MVVGRFAPSPSGRMHLGNVYTALLAWLSVRQKGGRFVLRIEDLDPVRCQPAYAWQLMEDLKWLGLDWDEGGENPSYWQSSRDALYAAGFRLLKERGFTYPCFCTRSQRLSEAPHGYEPSPRCPCARFSAEEILEKTRLRSPSYRFRVPSEPVSYVDQLQGPYAQNLASESGDFLIRRADGLWAYQLAVVMDDAAMGITQVVRGRDLLLSTPWQISLYRALNFTPPEFYHVPLLTAPDGRRLSKRDHDLDMGVLRQRYSPEALTGLLAWLTGQQPDPSPISAAALIERFDWNKLPKEDIVIEPNRFP